MVVFLKRYPIFLLFTLIPFGYLIGFIIEKLGGANIGLNFIRLTIILLIYFNKNIDRAKAFGLVTIYILFNIYFFEGEFKSKTREITSFLLYLVTVFSSKYIITTISKIPKRDIYKFIKWFTIIFTTAFIITAAIEGKKVDNSAEQTRSYYNGFIISHQFSYFSILLAFIFARFNKLLIASVLVLMALLVGNRTSYIILIFSFIIYLEAGGFTFFKQLSKSGSRFALIASISLLFYFFYINPVLNWHSIGDFLLDSDNRDFTSGRSLFWYNGLDALLKLDFISFNTFFGFGPAGVEILSSKLYNENFWMHNDFLQIYYCYGIVGISMYFFGLFYFARNIRSSSMIWLVLFTAFFNGFYTYGAIQLLIMIALIFIVKSQPMLKVNNNNRYNSGHI